PAGRAPRAETPLAPADEGLFEALRAERLRLARDNDVPAYVVCHDRTLAEMAAARPTTPEQLAAVHGMGPARIDRWGAPLLDVIRAGT
ncbi:MAG: HRDC domain-containing protein, partial [Myxococcota bacterium]